jgi:hypothetical protein
MKGSVIRMAMTIDRKKQSYLNEVEQKMGLELEAIKSHLPVLKSIIPVVRSFDNKVINKRFNDALKEATDNHVYCELNSGILSHSRVTNKTGNQMGQSWVYPQEFREVRIHLTMSQLNDKRLDATETIKNINKGIERLEEMAERFVYDEDKATELYNRLQVIEASIDLLFDDCDILTRQILKRLSYKLR